MRGGGATDQVLGSRVEVVVWGRRVIDQTVKEVGAEDQRHLSQKGRSKVTATLPPCSHHQLTSGAVRVGSRVSSSLNPRNFLS